MLARLAVVTPQKPSLQLAHTGSSGSSEHGSSPNYAPSSPLNPYTKGIAQPSAMSVAKRRSNFKTRRSIGQFGHEEPTYDTFMRDRIKAKCAERISKDRAKARGHGRAKSVASSSDGDLSSDVDMDDEEGDEVDDPMFLRIMTNEMRRDRHRELVNFERQVGSSFDPDVEDLDDWEGRAPVEDDDLPDDYFEEDDDFNLADYEDYLEKEDAIPLSDQPDLASPTPLSSSEENRNHFLNHCLQSPCLTCHHSTLSISPSIPNAIMCPSCQTTFPLSEVADSWAEDHSTPDLHHKPKWSLDPLAPTAILFECSSSDCFWLGNL